MNAKRLAFLATIVALVAGLMQFTSSSASAATTCVFTVSGTTMTLAADCTTDQTLFVPDGFTLDGADHTITAVDPAGGHFLGAVVRNAGTVAHVTKVTITAMNLANVCDPAYPIDNRLRGILFDDAHGSIVNTTVTGVRQGLSGCQEGNAIEVRNFEQNPTTRNVTISGNTVSDYQKNGITVNGAVLADVTNNSVTGDGPIDYIAQNGIQVAFGASATVSGNSVSGNDYTPASWLACGVLYYDATGVRAFRNHYSNNERNVCNFGKGGGNTRPNN